MLVPAAAFATTSTNNNPVNVLSGGKIYKKTVVDESETFTVAFTVTGIETETVTVVVTGADDTILKTVNVNGIGTATVAADAKTPGAPKSDDVDVYVNGAEIVTAPVDVTESVAVTVAVTSFNEATIVKAVAKQTSTGDIIFAKTYSSDKAATITETYRLVNISGITGTMANGTAVYTFDGVTLQDLGKIEWFDNYGGRITGEAALYIEDTNATISLKGDNNSIKSNASSSENYVYGIFANALNNVLTIEDYKEDLIKGYLEVEAGANTYPGGDSVGLRASDLIVDGCAVKGIGGATTTELENGIPKKDVGGEDSRGILANDSLTVRNKATVTGCGSVAGADSEGIAVNVVANGNLTVDDSTVKGFGKEAGSDSVGIHAVRLNALNYGEVGGTASNARHKSHGIFVYESGNGYLMVDNATVEGTGGNASEKDACGIYAVSLTALSGTVTGKSGEALAEKYYDTVNSKWVDNVDGGIYVENSPNIAGMEVWAGNDENSAAKLGSWNGKASSQYVKIQKSTYTPPPYTPPTRYDVILPDELEGGTVTSNLSRAVRGAKVTLTATPAEGYELESIAATKADDKAVVVIKNEDGTYSFWMPASDVTVSATFVCDGGEWCLCRGYTDLDPDEWYHHPVDYAIAHGLITGYTGTTLWGPGDAATRGMVATILHRYEGCPVPAGGNPFPDVEAGEWYGSAVVWANESGVIMGYGDAEVRDFGPADDVTREQLATILYRFAAYKGWDVSAGEDTNILDYPDAGEISEWAVPAMQWAVAEGLIGQCEKLNPGGSATRAELAAMLFRFWESYAA